MKRRKRSLNPKKPKTHGIISEPLVKPERKKKSMYRRAREDLDKKFR